MDQFPWSVMIFPILVTELKLGTSFLHQDLFCIIKFIYPPYPVETMIIAALVDSDLFPLFPGKQCMVTVRAVVLGFFSLSESLTDLKKGVTDLASQLSPSDPIVVVEIVMGSPATGTDNLFRYTGRGWAISDGG